MAVNAIAPFGFRPTRTLSGAPSFQHFRAPILSTNTTAIYVGDPVMWSGGYLVQATSGTTAIAGIFVGCEYQSISLKQPRNGYWPGNSDASANAVAQFIADPNAVFICQASAALIGATALGLNGQFVIGTGNTTTGFSGASLASTGITTTNTLPFLIVNLGPFYGSDSTTANNLVEVTFNNTMLKPAQTAV